ncbi:MAG: EpsG family protein [Magnetococcus sp. THC-1_WYH]
MIPALHLLMQGKAGRGTSRLTWYVFFVFLVLIIGLRYQVGGDWFTYLEDLNESRERSWSELFDFRKESGYTLINWSSVALGLDIYGINLVCAALFVYGLIKLAKDQPYPWLAIAAATPYLIIVVAMGYTRQAAAIGLLMYSVKYLIDNKVTQYFLVVSLAGLLHKTAFIFMAFSLFRPKSGLKTKMIGGVLLAALLYGTMIVEQAAFLMKVYVEETMESEGGQIRVLMNLPAALLLFSFWRKWGRLYRDRWFWSLIALLAIISLFLVAKASTAVDRMAIYFIPLQLVAYSRLPELMKGIINEKLIISSLVVYFFVVQFVWLVFGTHAPYWVPYRFFPIEWFLSLI